MHMFKLQLFCKRSFIKSCNPQFGEKSVNKYWTVNSEILQKGNMPHSVGIVEPAITSYNYHSDSKVIITECKSNFKKCQLWIV